MAHIEIKNIGPIKDINLSLNKVNVIMGPQSSGKSTIAKILCHCQWIEKQCYTNFEEQSKYYSKEDVFCDSLIEYHRLSGYFNDKSRIEYYGDCVTIKYDHKTGEVLFESKKTSTYKYPKIAYIPSERNLVAAIPNLKKYNESNDVILYFMYDWFSAREVIKTTSFSDILERDITYSYNSDTDYIIDDGVKLLLTNASSGVQSLIPLYMVILHTIEKVYQKLKPLSYEQKNWTDTERQRIEVLLDQLRIRQKNNQPVNIKEFIKQLPDARLSSNIPNIDTLLEKINEYSLAIQDKFKYKYTQLYIEEPEQNLFPESQQKFIYRLLDMIQANDINHHILLTTHSPYVLYAINNCVLGGLVEEDNIPKEVLDSIACKKSFISPHDVSVWELKDGAFSPYNENSSNLTIQDEDGLIRANYFDEVMKKTMRDFHSLINFYERDDK